MAAYATGKCGSCDHWEGFIFHSMNAQTSLFDHCNAIPSEYEREHLAVAQKGRMMTQKHFGCVLWKPNEFLSAKETDAWAPQANADGSVSWTVIVAPAEKRG